MTGATRAIEHASALAGEVIGAGQATWEVVAVRYGTRTTTRGDVYAAADAPEAPLRMDYFFWVLRGDAGTILVDTGFDPDVGQGRGRATLCPPVEALARLHVPTDAIDLVVLTHLHYDHTGNLHRLGERMVAVQTRELAFWTGPGLTPGHAVHVEPGEVERVAGLAERGRLRLLDGHERLAPGIGAILVPGHSPGQMALVVNGEKGPVLLASDAVHYYEELERRLAFAIAADVDEMRAGYDLVERLVAATGAVLVPGHDPEVAARFPPVDEDTRGIAVRVG